MYYYGNTGYYGNSSCYNPYMYAGYTNQSNIGAAIWIVLFILLVIIIGAGWFTNNNNR